MFEFSESIAGAFARLRAFPYSPSFAALPEATRGHLLSAIGEISPVPAAVTAMEALWAIREHLDEEARELAADLAHQVLAGAFFGKADRADAIVRHLRVDAGETGAVGLPEPPDPETRFLPPPPT